MDNQKETQGNGASVLLALSRFSNDHKELVKWYEILLVSSRAIALSLDPLFFFVPVIHEDKKCISEDKKMWISAIFWRSFLDIIYMVHFVVNFYIEKNKVESNTTSADESKGQRYKFWNISQEEKELWMLWMWFMFDIMVILPIPQVLMSNILSEMRHAKYTYNVTILNVVLLIQYVPRVLQIYLSLKELEGSVIPIRIRASFNFFLYLLAGHVFGAFWYFFSTQRLTSCWRKACLHQGGCVQGSFNCDHRFGNLSAALHDFCSIDSINTSTFDFGIFLEARRSGILESMDFPKKLIYSAWWGLRNLSSFGSNLQTSTYIWENAFALGISIFGLLLFLYFLGNLQVYMQRGASKSLEKSESVASKSLKKSESVQNLEFEKSGRVQNLESPV